MAIELASKMQLLFRELGLPEEGVASVEHTGEFTDIPPQRGTDGQAWRRRWTTGYRQIVVKYDDGKTRWRAYLVDDRSEFVEEAEWRPIRSF